MLNRTLRAACLSVALVGVVAACGGDEDEGTPSDPTTEQYNPSLGIRIADMTLKVPGLYYQDVVVGAGSEVVAGRTIRVNYTGWTADGVQFDSNLGGPPYEVLLGAGRVIKGWDQGLVGMRVGGRRKLVIGSALGYGSGGNPPIPPNATLVFDITLISSQ